MFESYRIASHDYWGRAKEAFSNFEETNNPKYVVYGCLELRNCIERVPFEYLVLIHIDEKKFKKFEQLYRTKDFKRAIYESEPDFDKKIDFINIYLDATHRYFGKKNQTVSLPDRIVNPDFELLSTSYGIIGDVLHSIKDPEKQTKSDEWNQRIYETSSNVFVYLKEIIVSGLIHFKMNDYGLLHYKVFCSNTIPNHEVVEYLIADMEMKESELIKTVRNGDLLSALLQRVDWNNTYFS